MGLGIIIRGLRYLGCKWAKLIYEPFNLLVCTVSHEY